MKKVLFSILLFFTSFFAVSFLGAKVEAKAVVEHPNDPAYSITSYTFTADGFNQRNYSGLHMTDTDTFIKAGYLYITTKDLYDNVIAGSRFESRFWVVRYNVSYNFNNLFSKDYFNLPSYVGKTQFVTFRTYDNISLLELQISGVINWSERGYFKPSETPVINTYTCVVNVNNMLTIDEILSKIKVTDDYDKDLKPKLDETNYDPANRKVGQYYMNISATDSSNNKALASFNINVVDTDKPVISGTSEHHFSYNDIKDEAFIKSQLTITDNYDNNLSLREVSNTFKNHNNKIGTYYIKYNTVDSSNNSSDTFTVTIIIEDKIAPIISVEGVDSNKNLDVANTSLFSLDSLRSKVRVNDEYDGTISSFDASGYDAYQNQYSISHQKFEITITAKDSSNNSVEFKFYLNILDKIAPQFEFDEEFFILLPEGQTLTDEQLKSLLASSMGISEKEIKSIEGELKGTKTSLTVILEDESKVIVNFEYSVDNMKVNMKWYEYIYKWFTIIFNLDSYYKTDNFFNFKERFASIVTVYSSGFYFVKA